jgi:ferredoxin-type protein NapH
MAKEEQMTYLSANGTTKIHAVKWMPEDGKYKAILQITHGMIEYIERYHEFAEYLTERGFMVVGHDHLGHGASVKDETEWGYFAENPSDTLVADMHRLRMAVQGENPGVPYFMMGHSMGSYMLRKYLCLHGENLSGAIIMGTGCVPDGTTKFGMTLCRVMARFRGWIQAAATLLTNIHIPNFFKGKIYQGNAKTVCVPGLNCYSCPAATGACPIGAFQAVIGSSRFKFSYYVTGFFILLGVTLGRFICGFLCPFGWFQDLLHKIPGKKFSTAGLKPLRYLKYMILIVFVILLPLLVTNSIGMGDPFFCKYICPQGVLEGAIPLSLGNAAIRSALGKLFSFKCFILITVVVLSILFYRPFCKWICPLGAIYSLFNKVSLLKIKVEDSKCIGCGQCSKVCKMDVDVCRHPDHPECIRCGACIKACPKDAIHYRFMGK